MSIAIMLHPHDHHLSGSSPYYAKNISEGLHKVLIIARRKDFYGGRIFDFNIRADQMADTQLELSLSEEFDPINGSITVTMMIMNDSQIQFMCYVGGSTLFHCMYYNFSVAN